MLTVKFSDTAKSKTKEVILWYDSQSSGVGEDFLQEIEDALTLAATMPHMNRVVYNNFHRCTLKKFPYSIYYEIVGDFLWVITIVHTSRHPDTWKDDID